MHAPDYERVDSFDTKIDNLVHNTLGIEEF